MLQESGFVAKVTAAPLGMWEDNREGWEKRQQSTSAVCELKGQIMGQMIPFTIYLIQVLKCVF